MTEGQAGGRLIVERKRKADGSVREYPCELVVRRPGVLVVRFRMPEGGAEFGPPIEVPPGSLSYGWFWSRRPYSLYRIFGPRGELLAHRFDAVADLRITDDAVEYRDLVLDWWVLPDDTILEEDRDELEELHAQGALSEADVEAANRAAYAVLSRYRHVIDEVVSMERSAGINVAAPAVIPREDSLHS